MLICMRTTLNLPDALFAEAKSRAHSEGRTLTSFLEEALREHLARETARGEDPNLPTYTPTTPGTFVDLDDKEALWNVLDRSA